jgi:hypothetical protein
MIHKPEEIGCKANSNLTRELIPSLKCDKTSQNLYMINYIRWLPLKSINQTRLYYLMRLDKCKARLFFTFLSNDIHIFSYKMPRFMNCEKYSELCLRVKIFCILEDKSEAKVAENRFFSYHWIYLCKFGYQNYNLNMETRKIYKKLHILGNYNSQANSIEAL